MATSSETKRSNGIYRSIYCRVAGQRKKIALGYVNKKAQANILKIVDELESLKLSAGSIPPALADKLQKLDPKIVEKLIKVGLVKKKESAPTLKELFDGYFEHKVKTIDHRSARNYRNAQQKFEDFMGADTKIDSIDESDVLLFIENHQKHANSTISNYLSRCSQGFRWAIKNKWLMENPFADLDERKRYNSVIAEHKTVAQEQLVTSEVMERLLTCPKSLRSEKESADWNVLVAILRWSACRVSTPTILRWDDVDFEGNEIRLRAKRTGRKRYKANERVEIIAPLWRELRVALELHREFQQESGQNSDYILNAIGELAGKPEFDITKQDGTVVRGGRWTTNLGATFRRIIKRNGIPDYPQPFHAIRKFRINEMERAGYRSAEIREWTGNSEDTAQKHYSKATKQDRQRALAFEQETASSQIVLTRSHQNASNGATKDWVGAPRRAFNQIRSDMREYDDGPSNPEVITTSAQNPAFLEVLAEQFSNGDQIEPEAMKSLVQAMFKMMGSE